MLVKASAPGSLMLLGEYAVMHGKHALVCAVDKRMAVTLETRADQQIIIHSALGNLTTTLAKLKIVPPFQFVIAVLKKYRPQLKTGLTISIDSDFSDQIGFASSAAVTVATLAALTRLLAVSLSSQELIKEARAIVRGVQGLGSGADVAACVLGGIVVYKMQPLLAEKISAHYPLSAIYSGYKTPTVEAVKHVKSFFATYPKLFKQICNAIDACVVHGAEFARAQDWKNLGNIFNIQQGLLESLGVNTPELAHIIATLRGQEAIVGAKISGSGLGDCAIGLGQAHVLHFNHEKIKMVPVKMTDKGVRCE